MMFPIRTVWDTGASLFSSRGCAYFDKHATLAAPHRYHAEGAIQNMVPYRVALYACHVPRYITTANPISCESIFSMQCHGTRPCTSQTSKPDKPFAMLYYSCYTTLAHIRLSPRTLLNIHVHPALDCIRRHPFLDKRISAYLSFGPRPRFSCQHLSHYHGLEPHALSTTYG